jgi:nitroreductase
MELNEAIARRRALRSLAPTPIGDGEVRRLAEAASLAASCFNNQPWRFVFVRGPAALNALRDALSKGNGWARHAPMIIAVASRRDLDCDVNGRDYWLFDTGMATAQMILTAVSMGLVAHPIAGYDEAAARTALGIPADHRVVTLVIVGAPSDAVAPYLSEKQAAAERQRPERKPFESFAYLDHWG